MTTQEIRFYELSRIAPNQAIPQLLYKIYDSLQQNILLLVNNQEEILSYDKLLWTFSSNKFLPHGIEKDGEDHYAPLLITDKEENLNQASIIVTNHLPSDIFIQTFNKQLIIFPEENKDTFLTKLNSLRESSCKVSYWKQDATGKWSNG